MRMVMTTMRGGLITSGMLMGGGPSQETAQINAPMIDEDKHQPDMPAPAPAGAPKEQEREIQLLESKQRVETNENGAELTPEQSANPHGDQSNEIDAMDMDHRDCEIECENNERPSTAQLEGEKDTEETLEEPTPGQPSDKGGYGERSYPPAMESPERHDSDVEP